MPLEEKYLRLIAQAIPAAAKPEILARFATLYDCVVETNQKINITSLVSPMEVTLKHIVDSLNLFDTPIFTENLSNQKICDVGCGGGFPGLPIAIVSPETEITMIDSTEKKIASLKENASRLGLNGVHPLWGRGEELASGRGGSHREKYDLCVSRAVARLPVLCELCLPFVRPGGYFIALKGARCMEEVEESRKAIPALGGALKEIVSIRLPERFGENLPFSPEEREVLSLFQSAERYLVVIEKKKSTNPIYPRKWAQMTKKSL